MASIRPMALFTTLGPVGIIMEGVWWWERAREDDRREDREARARRKGRAEPPAVRRDRRLPPLGRSILLVDRVAVAKEEE